MSRSMLFVSHANPEDNEFARWLALRLAAEGYPVWCDLTRLLGGERFWSDIENAIRHRTVKFLFVLSRSSNQKVGPTDELTLALNTARANALNDFVIPLWLDNLPALEFNVRLGGINAIPFNAGWASGLAQVLQKLDESGVKKDARFNPGAVGSWWLDNVSASRGVRAESEVLASNFYPILKTELFIYRLPPGMDEFASNPMMPVEATRGLLASFASPAAILADHPSLEPYETLPLSIEAPPAPPRGWSHSDLRRSITSLLNQHWRGYLEREGLHQHTFSGGQPAVYFTLNDLGLGRVTFSDPLDPGKSHFRQLIGYKTMAKGLGEKSTRRYWHFALEARADTELGYGFLMRPHVLFSDDGQTIWSDDDQLHRARRTQCKGWWNDKWRGLVQAGISQLNSGEQSLDLGNADAQLRISAIPSLVISPVTYDEPAVVGAGVEGVDEDDEPEYEDTDDDDSWER